MSTPCGCGQTPPPGSEYLLVQATASEAEVCADPTQNSTASDCPKKDQTYDTCLSDFLIPSEINSATMLVCNGKLYTVGQWIQFVNPVVKLKITGISNNVLTVVNRCDNGDIVPENPAIGQVISNGNRFVPVGPAFGDDDIANLDGNATELCTPNLSESTSSSIVQPVGRVESNPNNMNAGKCLRRIYGFLFDKGVPIFNKLGVTISHAESVENHYPLVINKTTHKIQRRKNYSESVQVNAGNRYLLSIASTGERIVGPTYVPKFFHEIVAESSTNYNPTTWDNFSGVKTVEFDLGAFADVMAVVNNTELDHYIAMLRIEISAFKVGSIPEYVLAEFENGFGNQRKACKVFAAQETDYLNQFNSVSVPFKIKKSDNKLILRLRTDGSAKFYYRIDLDGVYF